MHNTRRLWCKVDISTKCIINLEAIWTDLSQYRQQEQRRQQTTPHTHQHLKAACSFAHRQMFHQSTLVPNNQYTCRPRSCCDPRQRRPEGGSGRQGLRRLILPTGPTVKTSGKGIGDLYEGGNAKVFAGMLHRVVLGVPSLIDALTNRLLQIVALLVGRDHKGQNRADVQVGNTLASPPRLQHSELPPASILGVHGLGGSGRLYGNYISSGEA